MVDIDLEVGLKNLKESLQQMKALLAWEELKHSEAKPGQPPAFILNDPTETDLRNEYSFFLFTSVRMRSILNESTTDITKATLQRIKVELIKIERQFYSLNLHQRFLPR
ncbi:MAG: hypothetical protein ACYSSN_06625 [Planctomycetota bacterium]|jgi:hypothetical protein